MRRSVENLIGLMDAILPTILMIAGGLGTLYGLAIGHQGSMFIIVSLIMLLAGVSIYTYKQANSSEMFRRRLGLKEVKKKSGHKRHGKRCPQCERLIHHRRTVCQHCGYEFPSYKQGQESDPKQEDGDKRP